MKDFWLSRVTRIVSSCFVATVLIVIPVAVTAVSMQTFAPIRILQTFGIARLAAAIAVVGLVWRSWLSYKIAFLFATVAFPFMVAGVVEAPPSGIGWLLRGAEVVAIPAIAFVTGKALVVQHGWLPMRRLLQFLLPSHPLVNRISAYQHLSNGEFDKVVQLTKTIRGEDANAKMLMFYRAEALFMSERYEAAMRAYYNLLEIMDDAVIARARLGHIYNALDRHESAVTELSKIDVDGLNPEWQIYTRSEKAFALMELEFDREAIEEQTAILELDPERSDIRYERGLCNHGLENYELAERDWWKAAHASVADPRALITVANKYRSRGDPDTAIRYYQSAIDADSDLLDYVPDELSAELQK
jgi:tetratricopeptide (TPR) repeat protein